MYTLMFSGNLVNEALVCSVCKHTNVGPSSRRAPPFYKTQKDWPTINIVNVTTCKLQDDDDDCAVEEQSNNTTVE